MTLSWLVYIAVVSSLLGLAAHLASSLVGHRSGVARLPWAVAMMASVGVPAWAFLGPDAGPASALPAGVAFVFDPLRIGEVSAIAPDPLVSLVPVVWIGLSFGLVIATLWGAVSLRARSRAWQRARTCGEEVWISRDTGPAVVGVLESRIVLPAWLVPDTANPSDALRFTVAHERAHIVAGDLYLLAAGRVLLLLVPWNPVFWWMHHRLRGAVEADCDTRVLRAHPGRLKEYCEVLLSVCARRSARALSLALSEPRSTLERRIDAMTRSPVFPSNLRLAVVGGAIGSAITAACFFPGPDAGLTAPLVEEIESPAGEIEARAQPRIEEVDTPPEVETPPSVGADDIDARPTFTPFTERPELRNGSEVRTALELAYPPLLRDAGIGGQVNVWFLIEASGEISQTRIQKSSGHEALDEAALRVAEQIQFAPARLHGEPVKVWVAFPITFRTDGAP